MVQKGANHKLLKNRVSRIEGQMRGIASMIDSEKYCIDILTQIKATRSALKSLELQILEGHLNHCVRGVLESGTTDQTSAKIDEIMALLRQSSKS